MKDNKDDVYKAYEKIANWMDASMGSSVMNA